MQRMHRLKRAVEMIVRMEQQRNEHRQNALSALQQALEKSNVDEDLDLFADTNKRDHTQQYLHALVLLDWDWERSEEIRKQELQHQHRQQQHPSLLVRTNIRYLPIIQI
jgi:bisphosphoglycerate-independent phosphoglycerate mutase (AlkP superfamily)